MITIDRSSNIPVHEQLVEQLRYLIASGQYKIDETLPSTRILGKDIGISFHTVRKAYQQLEQEGLLEARVGSGFRVKERTPLAKSERMERGASIVQDALQKLIGLGMDESEVEYLFQEQLDLLSGQGRSYKLVFVAPYREMATLCAEQLTRGLQQTIEAVLTERLADHQDAEYIITPFTEMREVMQAVPRADVLGVATYLTPEVLSHAARLLPNETLGLVTRYSDAVQPLMKEIRAQTGFSGQAIATSIDTGSQQLRPFVEQTDVLVYTPSCRRRLLPYLDQRRKHVACSILISQDSLETVRRAVPG